MPAERYLIDGKRVPSVSSCKSMLGWGQRGLMHWANTKGLDGLTLEDAYRGGPAEVGTMAHAMIEADLRGDVIDTSAADEKTRDVLERIFDRWQEWREMYVGDVLLVEARMVHRELRYGGRVDQVFLGKDGNVWLLDVKTGRLYAEALVQAAGYVMLVEGGELVDDESQSDNRWRTLNVRGERGVDRVGLLRLGQTTSGISQFYIDRAALQPAEETFKLCRRLYDLKRHLEGEV